MMGDPFDLDRFIRAQANAYAVALDELQAGRKRSHWMWFIFPQIAGLGHSATSQLYAIRSLDEARAYLSHPTLRSRLHECLAALAALPLMPADAVFGQIDAIKLRSSLTLFVAAGGDSPVFQDALDRWFGGREDEATQRLLSGA